MNLVDLLAQQAVERPDATAIIMPARRGAAAVTFGTLDDRVRRGAALLRSEGVEGGHTVLVLQPISIELYVVTLALFRLGAAAMFVDPGAGHDHLEHACALARPTAFIGSAKAHLLRLRSRRIQTLRPRFVIGPPLPGAVRWSRLERCAPDDAPPPARPDTPALVTFTSGSTGRPKAAVRTHAFLLAQHRALAHTLHLEPGGVDLTTLPVFLLANLASGVTSVIPDGDLRRPGAINPGPLLAQLARHDVRSTAASPALLERLVEAAEADGTTLAPLRRIFTGGAPVFPGLLARLDAAVPDGTATAVYGSTEAEPIAHLEHADIDAADLEAMRTGAGLLAGAPVPEITLRVIDDRWGTPLGPFDDGAFDAIRVPAGAPGEIVVQGAHVLPGYLDGHGDEETKIHVGAAVWHRTGDAGRLDDLGRLWLLGRCAARLDDERGRLYPFGVECSARTVPGVRAAALVAGAGGRRTLVIEHERRGPVAARGLASVVHERVGVEVVDAVRLVDVIPMDRRHNAKIDYPALCRILARH